jgi:hypothetical protein
MENGFIIIKKETLQELVKNFYKVCSLADECNIYEHDYLDESMQEMKSWVDDKFGRTIKEETYE